MAHSSGRSHTDLSLLSRLLESPVVTVKVGPDLKEFTLHKELLCQRSQYFAKAFAGPFIEASTRVIILDDVSPVLFKIFIAWLYCGHLKYATSNDDTTILDDFRAFTLPEDETEIDEGGCEEDDRGGLAAYPEGDNPSTWQLDIFVELYLLGDRFDSQGFRIATVDAIINAWLIGRSLPSLSLPLRELMVHLTTYGCAFDRHYGAQTWEIMPVGFVAAVMVCLGRRLPTKQCSSCYHAALSDNHILNAEFPGLCKDEDLSPFEKDRCHYHQHETEDERKACREKREAAEGMDK